MVNIEDMIKPLLTLNWQPYRVTVFNLGFFALDGGAMFGVVPKTIWNRLMPADEKNRVQLATNCLLVEYDDPENPENSQKIMVDAGVGVKFSDKYQDIYKVEEASNRLGETPVDLALKSVNLTARDITQVIFTHLHFDHAGGGTRWNENGIAEPAFPNATYVIQKGEWDYATCPHERCKASYLKENLEPILTASNQLKLLEGNTTAILPGLSATVSGGHTPYHQVIKLNTNHGNLIHWGDLIPTRHHVRIPFVMGYDEYPIETMAQKRIHLQATAQESYLHVFEHDTEVPVATLSLNSSSGKPHDYCVTPVPQKP